MTDPKWEFDAPKFHDFEQDSPKSADCRIDQWFETSATKGLASPSRSDEVVQSDDGMKGLEVRQDEELIGAHVRRDGSRNSTLQALGKSKTKENVLSQITNMRYAGRLQGLKNPLEKAQKKRPVGSVKGVSQDQAGMIVVKSPVGTKEVKSSTRLHNASTTPLGPSTTPSPVLDAYHRDVHQTPGVSSVHDSSSSPPMTRSKAKIQAKENLSDVSSLNAKNCIPSVVATAPKMNHREAMAPAGKPKSRLSKDSMQQSKPSTKSWSKKLTVPKSPFLRSKRRCEGSKQTVKSSEELELEEIMRKKKEAEMLRKKSQRSIQAVRNGPPVTRSMSGHSAKRKNLTVPREPQLLTSKRQRTSHAETQTAKQNAVSFAMGTITTKRQQTLKGKRKIVPQGQKSMQTSTWKPKLTNPKTPNFATRRRARPSKYKTTEEIELEEIEKRKAELKAKVLDRKPLQHRAKNMVGPGQSSKPNKKPLTVPKPFSFATDKRVGRKTTAINEPPPFIFGQEGPVTRSKAAQLHTTSLLLETPAQTGSQRDIMPAGKHSAAALSTEDKEEQFKSRPRQRGTSMLRGGAVRVLRSSPIENPASMGSHSPVSAEKPSRRTDTSRDLIELDNDGVQDFIKVQTLALACVYIHSLITE